MLDQIVCGYTNTSIRSIHPALNRSYCHNCSIVLNIRIIKFQQKNIIVCKTSAVQFRHE